MKANPKETTWTLYECENSSRWSTAHEWLRDPDTGVCNFSGCAAKPHAYAVKGTTTDRQKAGDWFKRGASASECRS